ncbi:MAG: VOC family protein [Eubacteriales bacterium]|nr:VOC family protein [Eubacteriales bacterium]
MGVIRNLFHVSLQAREWDKALTFYRDVLGFEQMFELKVGQFKDMLQMGEHNEDDDNHWLTYLRVAPDEYIEMFNAVINPPEFKTEPLGCHEDTVLESFALGCENLEKTVEGLKDRGIEITDGYIVDPSGVKIRIVERSGHASVKERLFTSLAGISLYVNDLDIMTNHLKAMCFELKDKTSDRALFTVGEFGQYVELIQAGEQVKVYDDDLLGHFALRIYKVTDTVKAWGANGVHCCPQPFMKEVKVPSDDTAKGNVGLDGCEIIWMVCPEGNKIEVMVEPGNTMQQEYERTHVY